MSVFSKLALDDKNPLRSATTYIDQVYRLEKRLSLRHHGGVFYRWKDETSYRPHEEATLRSDLYRFLAKATIVGTDKPFLPTSARVSDIVDAIRAVSHLPTAAPPPCWLDGATGHDALDLMPCANGLLHLPTRVVTPSSPLFFALSGIDFSYDASAPAPLYWLRFLHELWPEDADAQETLQEWIGYLLTMRTHFQKMLLLVGPKRSGKGTIGRVIRHLIGQTHVAGPTLANLSEQFGLAVLVDKSVALIADARISGRADMAVLSERLLSISGEDTLSIPRKFLPDWTGKLPTRFMLMTNELPRIEDASGALASRFLVLMLQQSFYGREDHDLFARFVPELPGILNWALDGLDRLRTRGRFQQPESSAAIIQEFEDLGSPIAAFLRDCAVVKSGLQIRKDRFYEAWKIWCKETGREHPGTTQTFGRNIRAALPFVSEVRPRIDGERTEHYLGVALKSEQTGESTF